MSNHKYFPTKELYDKWVRENTKALILDVIELDKGIYIDYITYVEDKKGRLRKW